MSEIVKHSLEHLIQAVKTDGGQAQTSFEASSVLTENLSVKCRARNFEFTVDEPELLGGKDQAANPVEYLLGAFGACQAITYKALASLKGIDLHKVEVKAKGEIDLRGFLGVDQTTRPGYQNITFETTVVSDENPDKIKSLAQQVETLCPVLDNLSQPLAVNGELKIERPDSKVLS